MQHVISRRGLLKNALVTTAFVPAIGLIATDAHAAELTPLDPNEPGPKAFGFVNDATKVDTKAHPTYAAGQHCSVCAQFRGKPVDTRGGCSIFTDHSVP